MLSNISYIEKALKKFPFVAPFTLNHHRVDEFVNVYSISRKVVGKNVHGTIPKGSMGYDQHAVPDTVAVESSIVAFL